MTILRVLCLHGSHQCGEIFSQRLHGLVKRLARCTGTGVPLVQLLFMDAPHELPLREVRAPPFLAGRYVENIRPTPALPCGEGVLSAHGTRGDSLPSGEG